MMFLENGRMAKMSEGTISGQYSKYLQAVAIAAPGSSRRQEMIDNNHFLSYAQFKEYYIQGLIGKDEYVDKLVFVIQGLRSVEGR